MTTHFVGVGGIGMSGLARVLAARGVPVSGCDRADGPALAALRGLGIACATAHDPAHLAGVDRLVVSGAIDADEPELVRARELGVPVAHRADVLAEVLARHDRRVVVTGAHGKTTTTGMVAFALDRLGRAPTFLVGGEVRQLGTNAAAGDGEPHPLRAARGPEGRPVRPGRRRERSQALAGADAEPRRPRRRRKLDAVTGHEQPCRR